MEEQVEYLSSVSKTEEQYKKNPTVLIVGFGVVGHNLKNLFPWADVYDVKFKYTTPQFMKEDGCYYYSSAPSTVYDYAIIAVPTPKSDGGSADLSFVKDAISSVKASIYLIKSAVPPTTTDSLKKEYPGKHICVSPEYQGATQHALQGEDFLIVGGDREDTDKVVELWQYIFTGKLRTYQTTAVAAELCKYMENSFLATKVVFCNEFYRIAKAFGVNYSELRELFVADPRVNKSHTFVYKDYPFYDSKCFNKDLPAIVAASKEKGYDAPFIQSVIDVNEGYKKGK